MKQFKRIIALVLVLATTISYALIPASSTSAVSSSALSIPPKKNYVIDPGKTVKDKLTISNLDSNAELDLSLRVIDFTFNGNDGTPKLMLDPKAPQTTWSLKSQLTVPQSVSIPPGQTKTLDMSVTIPKNQGAGSYYSAIIYSSGSGGASGFSNVGLSASGVTLVFVNVPGKVHEDLRLTQFGAYTDSYQFITSDEPKNFAYSLENKGNVAESPVGSITLNDMWGHKRTITNVNPNGSLVLIGQTRTFLTCIQTKAQTVNFSGTRTEASDCVSAGLWPGLYTATIDLLYGQNGNMTQEVIKTATFWYLPWWFVIAVLIVLALITYFVWRIVRFVRRKLDATGRGRRSSRRR